jgi:hypothetical protein
MRWRRRGAGDIMATKDELLKQRAAVEAECKVLAERRAELAADLAEARQVVNTERGSLTRAILGRLKLDPGRLAAARAREEVLPAAIAELDRQALAAGSPLAAIEQELARLEAADLAAEGNKLIAELRAGVVAMYAQYARLAVIEQALGATAPGAAIRSPYWEAAYRLRGVGMAKEILDWHDGGGR